MTEDLSRENPIETVVVLERDPGAPARARSFLSTSLAHFDRLDDATLALSELVTNAVEHADSGTVRVRVEATDQVVRVEVVSKWRSSVDVPSHHHPPPGSHIRGRGLLIVRAVADRMGIDNGADTTVWFELEV